MNEAELMSDDAFDELEALLTSEDVPAETMSLEMLDGYLAAVLVCPGVLPVARWMAPVWSADDEAAGFADTRILRRAIVLVRMYYNELASTIGGEGEWEPFCYALDETAEQEAEIALGEEWIEGFSEGMDLWPADWEKSLTPGQAEVAGELIDDVFAPWVAGEDEAEAWVPAGLDGLAHSAAAVRALADYWRSEGLARPVPLEIEPAQASLGGPGRNEPCPCGSGKKYKKCCGAVAD